MDYLRFDCLLREILEDRKTVTGFLDAVFGFMSRNTDFYHIQNSRDDKLGFPKGVKEQILLSCMQKYEKIELSEIGGDIESPSIVAEEIEVVTEESNEEYNKNQQTVDTNVNDFEMIETSNQSFPTTTIKFSESDYRNGSVFENYCWSQTLKDVELNVLLPKDVKLAKHIKLELKSNHITIKTIFPKEEIIINADTWSKYRYNDVIWSISDGKLVISFDKLNECWWDKLFLNETSINIKNVDTERSMNEYSQDVKNSIEKLHMQQSLNEHDLKSLPLNESEQMARLRQAWNIEGSPFKGQPFDPSVVHFN